MGKKFSRTDKKIRKYDEEKAEIQKEAKSLEEQRDVAVKHSLAFGYAVILFQLAILLSSIAALMKKPRVWYLGLVLGVVGAFYFANGFWLFL